MAADDTGRRHVPAPIPPQLGGDVRRRWPRSLGARAEDLPTVAMADSGRPSAFSNCATLMQPLSAESAAATMRRDRRRSSRFDDPSRHGEVLLASAWPTGDLRPYGWNLMGHPPLHLLPAGATPRADPPELRDRRSARSATRYTPGSGSPSTGSLWTRLAGAPPGSITSEALARRSHGRGCGSAGSRSARSAPPPPGSSTASPTSPRWRRCRTPAVAATAKRSPGAPRSPIPSLPAMLLSSDDGRPVYDRMGFLPLWRLTLWYRNRPD